MAYTTNKEVERVRRQAVELVRRGWSSRKVGRHLGYHHTAVMKWVKRAEKMGTGGLYTRSSAPKTNGRYIDNSIKQRIIDLRIQTRRCAEVIHLMILKEGMKVSRNTVQRVLDRAGLTKKRSLWKRYHPPIDRPYPAKAGDLVEIDTIHTMQSKKEENVYLYAHRRIFKANIRKELRENECFNFSYVCRRSTETFIILLYYDSNR